MAIKCDITIKINASNLVEEAPINNFEMKCKKDAIYSLRPKGVEGIMFFCCQKHSDLFLHKDYHFQKV